jgi:hypothetical protein
VAILVGDATRNELDPDALAVRAFELFCGRSGVRVMALPVAGISGLAEVVQSLSPDAVVLAGSHVADDDVALWAYRVRASAGPLPLTLFRRAHRASGVRMTGAHVLSDRPFSAHRQLLAVVDERRDERVGALAPVPAVALNDVREAQA